MSFAKAVHLRFTVPVFRDFTNWFKPQRPVPDDSVRIGVRNVPLLVVRNPRARRYLLRLQPDGTARVTIPRGGNRAEAQSFVDRNRAWLEQQLHRLQSQPRHPPAWQVGSEILFRGELVRIDENGAKNVKFGSESVSGNDTVSDLRPIIEKHLRGLASLELPARVRELAALHQLPIQRITVRNQRQRWGSCSRRGNISLNWRLIQTPVLVRDYIILHELAHLRQMNHSDKFWREVERLCPGYLAAEQWLKAHRQLLR
jgi:hypothetical protein